jgi:6-phosphogluconolactonase
VKLMTSIAAKLRACGLLLFAAFVLPVSGFSQATPHSAGGDYFLYAGTYTGFKFVRHNQPQLSGQSHSEGIYVARFHAATGKLDAPQLATKIANPSFIAVSPDGRFLYAVSEDPTSVGPPLDHASYVFAYAIDAATGKLRLLNTRPTGGTSTCFIATDKTGRYVMMANFGSGSISVISVHADGSLDAQTAFMQHIGHSKDPAIQNMPHPHSIIPSPDNKHVIVSDLGLDKIFVYNFDQKTGELSPPEPNFAAIEPGSGPRHFMFTPNGNFGYQLSEMSGHVDAFRWNAADAKLVPIEVIKTVTPGLVTDNHSAEIAISKDNRFLYESNRRVAPDGSRGPDSIGVYAIDAATGKLTQIEEHPTVIMPRNFAIDPTGGYLLVASELYNKIVLYKIDRATGKLTATGSEVAFDTPVCLVFVAAK